VKGGQTIEVKAPIDQIPLFVRAGSIIPMAAPMNSTAEAMKIAKVRVYGGANSSFTLYDDDGVTYAYEQGAGRKTELHWDEAAGKLSHEGAAPWSEPDSDIVEVVGKQTR
jgi:alpha-glucosidase (family GH31 glycosyl hydrolase)